MVCSWQMVSNTHEWEFQNEIGCVSFNNILEFLGKLVNGKQPMLHVADTFYTIVYNNFHCFFLTFLLLSLKNYCYGGGKIVPWCN